MARIRSSEFVTFVQSGKTFKFGALTMKGNEVRSYNTVIATVDRDNKTVTINPRKYSVTTTIHQRAAEIGTHYLSGYTVSYLSA
jgi:hypothetical protein